VIKFLVDVIREEVWQALSGRLVFVVVAVLSALFTLFGVASHYIVTDPYTFAIGAFMTAIITDKVLKAFKKSTTIIQPVGDSSVTNVITVDPKKPSEPAELKESITLQSNPVQNASNPIQ
jgi:hypothetical protein